MQWTTGDNSGGNGGLGGTEALAGINVGDGVNSTTIPGSLTPSIINIAQTSNVGIPGIWMFQVQQGIYNVHMDFNNYECNRTPLPGNNGTPYFYCAPCELQYILDVPLGNHCFKINLQT